MVIDAWVIFIAMSMRLEAEFAEKLCLPNTGGLFLSNRRDWLPQAGHNDFEQKDVGCSGYFMIRTGSQTSFICVCSGSHKFVHFPMAAKKELCKILEMRRWRFLRSSSLLDMPIYQILWRVEMMPCITQSLFSDTT